MIEIPIWLFIVFMFATCAWVIAFIAVYFFFRFDKENSPMTESEEIAAQRQAITNRCKRFEKTI